ncbi:bacterial Ig-like domain-containing protein, partial [Listeria monocytogenes]
ISATINVTVKPRKTTVKIHDSSFYAGNSWNAKDNFDHATNKAGEKVAFKDITVAGNVDSKTPGTYEISYVYDGVKAVAKVTVLKNHSILMVKDRVIKVGEKWNAKDSFIQATRRDGKNIPFSQVKVQGKVNLNKAGKYQVIYSVDPNEGTEDAGKQMLSVTATIQVENRGDAGLQDNE